MCTIIRCETRHVGVTASSNLRVKTIKMAFLHRQSVVETWDHKYCILSLGGADAAVLCNRTRVQ